MTWADLLYYITRMTGWQCTIDKKWAREHSRDSLKSKASWHKNYFDPIHNHILLQYQDQIIIVRVLQVLILQLMAYFRVNVFCQSNCSPGLPRHLRGSVQGGALSLHSFVSLSVDVPFASLFHCHCVHSHQWTVLSFWKKDSITRTARRLGSVWNCG